jgi:hypothetical protein
MRIHSTSTTSISTTQATNATSATTLDDQTLKKQSPVGLQAANRGALADHVTTTRQTDEWSSVLNVAAAVITPLVHRDSARRQPRLIAEPTSAVAQSSTVDGGTVHVPAKDQPRNIVQRPRKRQRRRR